MAVQNRISCSIQTMRRPQYTGLVTKKARTGADQTGAGAVPKQKAKHTERVIIAGLTGYVYCIIRYSIYEKQDHGTLKSTS